MKKIVLLIISIMFLSAGFAQQVKSYTVKSGETIYSICQQNNITQEQLQSVNPSITNSIRAGQIIQIPIIKAEAQSKKDFEEYKVKRKETLYGISRAYNLTVQDLIKYNPWAEQGIHKKDILLIPIGDESKNKVAEVDNFPKEKEVASLNAITHEVKSGETLYAISKRYNCPIEALETENPKVKTGLKVGMVLTIPKVAGNTKEVNKVTTIGGNTYTAKSGDTVYRIAKKYNLTTDQLIAINPTLKTAELQPGMVVVIPAEAKKVNQANDEVVQQVAPKANPEAMLKQYNVAILLPFSAAEFQYILSNQDASGLESAQGDSAQSDLQKSAGLISAKSKGFLQMYQGILLAIEKMRIQGMQVNVRVFDTESSLATVKNIVEHPDFRAADLIIGPVYPQNQGPVAEYALANKIPMISPLSSTGNFENTNPYYFKVNPLDKLIADKTEQYLTSNFKNYNLVAIKLGTYGYLNRSDDFKKQFKSYLEYDPNTASAASLKARLAQSKELYHNGNVAYIPFDEETKVSVGVSELSIVDANYPITLVGKSNYLKFKSIQTEYYHRLDLHVLSPYHINYASDEVNSFVRNYRANFYSEPSQFAFQGYDVAYYFLGAMFKYGSDLGTVVSNYHPQLLQGNFQFKKLSPSAGWVNEGLFILEYKPDFTIIQKGTM